MISFLKVYKYVEVVKQDKCFAIKMYNQSTPETY